VDFVVIDVETANGDPASICQVGIASFRDGELADAWVSLVNPQCDFNAFNITVHGIDEDQVQFAPTWSEVFPEIASRLQDYIVVSHTPFDQRALARACEQFNVRNCECTWLDSAKVVRIAWPQFAKSGYGLPNVAKLFGIQYQAHDALEDARCAGLLLLRAVAETGLSPQQWLTRVTQPIAASSPASNRVGRSNRWPEPCKREANPDGELFGEILVFTGTLSIPRGKAADLAAVAGCRVEDGVTRHTTILVVGGEEQRNLASQSRSSKELKAEQLVRKGRPIRIVGESEFLRIVARTVKPDSGSF